MEMKINSGEGKQYCLKPKPGAGGVLPAKRRSVKSLILEDFLQCFRSLLSGTTTSSTTPAPSAGVLTDNDDKTIISRVPTQPTKTYEDMKRNSKKTRKDMEYLDETSKRLGTKPMHCINTKPIIQRMIHGSPESSKRGSGEDPDSCESGLKQATCSNCALSTHSQTPISCSSFSTMYTLQLILSVEASCNGGRIHSKATVDNLLVRRPQPSAEVYYAPLTATPPQLQNSP